MSLIAKEKGFGKWMLGKKCPWNIKNHFKRGKEHPRWKGGISKTREYQKIYSGWYDKRRRKLGLLPLYTVQLVYEDNIKQYGTLTCYLCLKPIEFGDDCLEHKIPISKNGTHQYSNLAIAHKSCNCKKHNKTPEEYKEWIEKKSYVMKKN